MTTPILLLALALVIGVKAPSRRLAGPTDRSRPGRRWVRLLPVVAVVAVVATVAFLVAGRVSVVFAALIAAATATFLIDAARHARRARNVDAATATILGLVVAELRAGALIGQSFARATESLPDSAPDELKSRFQAVAAHTSRGGSGHTVLAEVPELSGLAKTWSLAETHGLPAAALLEQARSRLIARARHRSATTASLQGPQATSVILSALPLAGIALGSSMGADPLGFLMGGGIGGILLVAGITLICGGLLISRTIIARASA